VECLQSCPCGVTLMRNGVIHTLTYSHLIALDVAYYGLYDVMYIQYDLADAVLYTQPVALASSLYSEEQTRCTPCLGKSDNKHLETFCPGSPFEGPLSPPLRGLLLCSSQHDAVSPARCLTCGPVPWLHEP
jgi:hypothetical protein